jgi:hypothetical protein
MLKFEKSNSTMIAFVFLRVPDFTIVPVSIPSRGAEKSAEAEDTMSIV